MKKEMLILTITASLFSGAALAEPRVNMPEVAMVYSNGAPTTAWGSMNIAALPNTTNDQEQVSYNTVNYEFDNGSQYKFLYVNISTAPNNAFFCISWSDDPKYAMFESILKAAGPQSKIYASRLENSNDCVAITVETSSANILTGIHDPL